MVLYVQVLQELKSDLPEIPVVIDEKEIQTGIVQTQVSVSHVRCTTSSFVCVCVCVCVCACVCVCVCVTYVPCSRQVQEIFGPMLVCTQRRSGI